MADATKALLMFTFRPVQPFIEQARKTRDMANASGILSDLAGTAIDGLQSACGNHGIECRLIFPYDGGAGGNAVKSLPNRFVAELTFGGKIDASILRQVGNAAEGAFTAFLTREGEAAYRAAGLDPKIHPANFNRYLGQLEDYFQAFWAAVPIEPTEGYKGAYDKVIAASAGIKAAGLFGQISSGPGQDEASWGEGNRKCSLTGEQEVLFYRELAPAESSRKRSRKIQFVDENIALPLKSDKSSICEEGDALGGLGLFKRFYQAKSKRDYPSVSRVALQPVFKKLVASGMDCPYFEDDEFCQYFFAVEDEDADEIEFKPEYKDWRRKIKDKAKSLDQRITPYYAVLVFDADEMGKWLRGDFAKTCSTEKLHLELSRLVSDFAHQAREMIKNNYNGFCVYAGGDDFFGFLPLAAAMPAAQALRQRFSMDVGVPLQASCQASQELTFSAGIAIAHYKTPLSYVVKSARQAEQRAKTSGRDAFAVNLIKHSGEEVQTTGKWQTDRDGVKVDIFAKFFAGAELLQGGVSTGHIEHLLWLIDTLGGVWQAENQGLIPADLQKKNDLNPGDGFVSIDHELLVRELQRKFKSSGKTEKTADGKIPAAAQAQIDALCDTYDVFFRNSDLTNFRGMLALLHFVKRHLSVEEKGGKGNEN